MKLMLLIFAVVSFSFAQNYPRWFLFQGDIPCQLHVAVVSRAPSFYRDSTIALAFRSGCDLLAKYTNVRIRGGQAFWTTEAGVHSMGSRYVELYDTLLNDYYQSTLNVLAWHVDKKKAIVLTGDSSRCLLPEDLNNVISVESIPQPSWVENIPDHPSYFYGVGSSESYYYESSSWERAEQNALMSLARTRLSSVISLQKSTQIESQELFNEELDVELSQVEITARWRDMKKKVFYVLARIKR